MTFMEMAKVEWAQEKDEHDKTGEHVWLEITAYGDAEKRFICKFCSARESRPFDEPSYVWP